MCALVYSVVVSVIMWLDHVLDQYTWCCIEKVQKRCCVTQRSDVSVFNLPYSAVLSADTHVKLPIICSLQLLARENLSQLDLSFAKYFRSR